MIFCANLCEQYVKVYLCAQEVLLSYVFLHFYHSDCYQYSHPNQPPLQKSAGPSSKKAKPVDSTSTNADGATTTGTSTGAGAVEKKVFNVNTIRFKFNQGFSNAVKRTVLMDEFL